MLNVIKQLTKPYLLFEIIGNDIIIADINDAFSMMMGISSKPLKKKYQEFTPFLKASFVECSLLVIQESLRTKSDVVNTLQREHSNEHIEIQCCYFEQNHGVYILMTVSSQESILIHNTSFFEKVVAHTTDAVLILEKLQDKTELSEIVYVNQAFCELTGYDLSEVIGNTIQLLNGPNTDWRQIYHLKETLQKKSIAEISLLQYKKSKESFWANIKISPIYNDLNTEIIYWLVLAKDITSQKNEECKEILKKQIRTLFSSDQKLDFILSEICSSIIQELKGAGIEVWINTFKDDIVRYGNHENLIFPHYNTGYDFVKEVMSKKSRSYLENKSSLSDINIIGLPLKASKGLQGALLLGIKEDTLSDSVRMCLYELGEVIINELERKQIEQELAQIFEYAPDMICVLGLDGFFKKVNPSFCEVLGYSKEELLSKSFHTFIHPEDQKTGLEAFASEKDFSKVYVFENRYIKKSGEIANIAWRSSVKLDGKHLLAIGRDITDERKLQLLLNRTNLLSKIVSWEFNLKTENIFVSDNVSEIFGYTQEEFRLSSMNSLFDIYREGEHRERATAYIKKALQIGESWSDEFIILLPNSTERWVKVIGEASFVNGKCERIYGSIQDINTRKVIELALKEAINQKNEILETTGDTFLTLDQNWTVTYWNAQATKLTGVPKEEIVGKIIWEVFPEGQESDIYVNLTLSRKENIPITFNTYYAPIDKWVEIRCFPAQGLTSIYARDITEAQVANQKLREERNLLRTLIDNLPETVYFKDTEARKVISNRVDYLFLGASSEQEVLGKTDLELFDSDLGAIGLEHDLQVLRTGEPIHDFTQLHAFQGKPDLWLESTKIPVKNEDNIIIGVLGIGRDITLQKQQEFELKKLNLELEEHIKQLQESNNELEQFAYVASHDLQEPLRMITSFLSQIETKYSAVLDERGRQYIWYATDGAVRMRQIILDLLNFSRVGRIEEQKQQVDIGEVIKQALLVFQTEINTSHAEITVGKMPILFSNKLRIEQVFQNLISNALKYRQADVNPIIEIQCEESPTHWIFSVKDNGIGIEEEYFHSIFTIFQRLHTRDEYPGTGIGLAIVKKIVEMLEGKVWVESIENQGSTFYFSLKK